MKPTQDFIVTEELTRKMIPTQDLMPIETKTVSLVPDYSSDSNMSENKTLAINNSDNHVSKKLTTPANNTRRSQSSSSSSSRSSSSSSDSSSSSSLSSSSSSSSSSQSSNCLTIPTQNSAPQNVITDCEENTSYSNSPQNSKRQKIQLRERRNYNSVASYNISPVYTDRSDVDLSDDDPTVDFNMLFNKPAKRRNFLFENQNSSDSDYNSKPNICRGRKRSLNVEKWQQIKSKRLRNKGQSYVSMSKTRKTIPARFMKDTCTEKCKFKCAENIDSDGRYKLFDDFWSLGNLVAQRAYIRTCMVDIAPKYKYTNSEHPRRPNKAFYFILNNISIRVCKIFFKNTLSISERMVYTVQSRMNDGFMMDDLRGKHNQHKKLNPALLEDIRNHINMIPKIESHYVRAKTSKQYIGGDKTIKDLYNDFATQQTEANRDKGNYMAYYKVFNKEFNLGFHRPKKDQCDLCVSYDNSNNEQKQDLEDKYLKHLEEKTLSRSEKLADRQNITKDRKVVIYDLEAVLQCPRGDTSAFYYKSKLNSYNLTLTELLNGDKKAYENVHCYFWTEVDAKRGANEIGSCVWKYLQYMCSKDADPKEIIFYSDNCCGQNKNKYIATLYLYAVTHLNINSITHKFLIRGHTQNEADSIHSLIEREVKKNLKSGPIYSPDQYVTLIKNAKKTKPSINVHELTFESFMNLKALQEEWGYNFNTDIDGKNVNWNDIKILRMVKSEPFNFYYKTSYNDTIFKQVDVRNKRKKMNQISEISLNTAYTERQQLSANKKKDLKELITKKLIPSFYANFYNSII